ncbi:MAG: hypothetical protein GX095_02210 [Clostridiales bacterium]|jgi:hypothetical protein|nr:hypothetical protein [Clostridiales bacterium]HOB63776.1 hypothetical protein [Clostridia bacterium]HOK81922.1 hypothetical protein [Clostridia bacterium]HOL61584.1 hypothetical protein [Clostridia bacterium]HPO54243.1 hypothetical protein [Clostridia bacterium]
MDKYLIYQIGEAILLEVGGVTNIIYPKGADTPDTLIVESKDGRYSLKIKAV